MKKKDSTSKQSTISGLQVFEDRLNKKLLNLEKGLEASTRVNIQIAVREIIEHVDNKLTKFSSLILTTVDPLLKELETRDEDRALTTNQIADVRQQIQKLDKRVKKLEYKQAA